MNDILTTFTRVFAKSHFQECDGGMSMGCGAINNNEYDADGNWIYKPRKRIKSPPITADLNRRKELILTNLEEFKKVLKTPVASFTTGATKTRSGKKAQKYANVAREVENYYNVVNRYLTGLIKKKEKAARAAEKEFLADDGKILFESDLLTTFARIFARSHLKECDGRGYYSNSSSCGGYVNGEVDYFENARASIHYTRDLKTWIKNKCKVLGLDPKEFIII
jgi:hypothetical protein